MAFDKRKAAWGVLLMLGSGIGSQSALAAASLYVTDSVSVGVYGTAELLGDPAQRLISGTPIEVLQNVNGVAQIQTSSGTVGWIRASFVSSQVPSAHKLDDALTRIDELQQEIIDLSKALEKSDNKNKELQKLTWVHGELKKARATIKRLTASQEGATQTQGEHEEALSSLQQQVDELSSQNADLLNRLAASELIITDTTAPFSSNQAPPEWGMVWLFGLTGLTLGLAAGFGAGHRWLSQRIAARFGGLKLY